MPTVYTERVESGEVVELQEFAFHCARTYTWLMSMAGQPVDAPVPDTFEPNPQIRVDLDLTRQACESIQSLTEAQLEEKAQQHNQMQYQSYVDTKVSTELKLARLQQMQVKVKRWDPPEPYVGLKAFMLDQLCETIADAKIDMPYYPAVICGSEWKDMTLKNLARREIELEAKYNKEVEWCNQKTSWVRGLKQALEKLGPMPQRP